MIPGIDAGNSRFKSAVSDAAGNPKLLNNRFGESFTHAVVYFNTDGTVIVGTEALNAALADPSHAVFNWKRHMGTPDILMSINGKDYTAKDILAILLKNAKEDIEAKTGEVVNEVVITVPANYTDVQKQDTIDAAAAAGMKTLLTPNEPTAAALGNDVHRKGNVTILIYDLGGCTFDCSVVRNNGNNFQVIATNGEPKLGGQDFNNRVAEKILDQFELQHKFRPDPAKHPIFFQDMHQRLEQGKICLSIQQQFPIVLSCEGKMLNMTITRKEFEAWIKDLVDITIARTEQTLKDSGMTWSDIDEILAVGGSSQIPVVVERLEKASDKKISRKCEPYCAAALGAVVAGRMECERQGRVYMIEEVALPSIGFYMHEILSHTIGVLVLSNDSKEICSQILAKGIPIPSVQTCVFKLTQPNQTDVYIQVLEGTDGAYAKDCIKIGHFELKGLPARPDLIGRIEITIHLDVNGMLTATARDNVSGKTEELKIDYKNNVNAGTVTAGIP
ncbi:MAG: Hsp70 family protein [Sedimentisphaerales bacterium]|jgi:molecular chaperone DnaK